MGYPQCITVLADSCARRVLDVSSTTFSEDPPRRSSNRANNANIFGAATQNTRETQPRRKHANKQKRNKQKHMFLLGDTK